MTSIIRGGKHEDARGKLIFFNDFDMKQVRRLYVIEHPDTSVIRAWQGHKKEQKWFYVIAGSFKVVMVQPDDWLQPSPNLETHEFVLEQERNEILHVPGGFANGFKALEDQSKMMVFSNFTVEESSRDNFRFDYNKWYNWEI
jgi:dTDP-4-dehydrorhamnose 3,5-epimerase